MPPIIEFRPTSKTKNFLKADVAAARHINCPPSWRRRAIERWRRIQGTQSLCPTFNAQPFYVVAFENIVEPKSLAELLFMSPRRLSIAHWAGAAIVATSVLSVLPGTAHGAADGLAITTQGANGAPACMLCHGAQGEGNPAANFPRLAGAGAAYLKEQLDAIASGSRVSPVMAAIAKTLEPAQREAVARFYASLPLPLDTDRLAATALQSPKADDVGAWLAVRGAWDRNIPACNQCHGPGGIGVGAHFPSLAGQPATYIAEQLRLWRENRRPPGPLDLMASVATRLTDAEIDAVSAYYAGLPKTADPLATQASTAAKAKP